MARQVLRIIPSDRVCIVTPLAASPDASTRRGFTGLVVTVPLEGQLLDTRG